MILDTLANAAQYFGIHPGLDMALKAAGVYTPDNYPTESLHLGDGAVTLNFCRYETSPLSGAKMEAHRRNIDVMIMVDGEETIYVKPVDQLSNVTRPYCADDDALLADLDQDMTPVRLKAGSFVVLFPQDAHCPGRCVEEPKAVKKIIAKVLV